MEDVTVKLFVLAFAGVLLLAAQVGLTIGMSSSLDGTNRELIKLECIAHDDNQAVAETCLRDGYYP